MKKVLILILLVTNVCFAQKQIEYLGFDAVVPATEINYLQGSWGIDFLITQQYAKEYNLFKRTEGREHHYGNNLTFNLDGSFSCGYSAPCGNDCFASSAGKYKMINESYICIFLEHEWRHGECDFSDLDSTNTISYYDQKLSIDLGVFRIYKVEGGFQLLKSDGNPENDKKILRYIEMLTQKSEEILDCRPPFAHLDWHEMVQNETKTIEDDIVKFIANQLQFKEFKILYNLDFEQQHLILVKTNSEFRYVLWRPSGTKVNVIDVAVYDDFFFEDFEHQIHKIDNDKNLEKRVYKEFENSTEKAQLKNTITLFTKNGEPQKLIYDKYNSRGYYKMVYYIKDGKPFVVKIQNEKRENFTFYVFNSELSEGAVVKPYEDDWSFSFVHQTFYRILELTKK